MPLREGVVSPAVHITVCTKVRSAISLRSPIMKRSDFDVLFFYLL